MAFGRWVWDNIRVGIPIMQRFTAVNTLLTKPVFLQILSFGEFDVQTKKKQHQHKTVCPTPCNDIPHSITSKLKVTD